MTTEHPTAEPPAADERVDPYEVVITSDGTTRAPRLSAAWKAIQAVLADGKVHRLEDLLTAASDLAENSVRLLLKAAIDAGRIDAIYDGRNERRAGNNRVIRKYRMVK